MSERNEKMAGRIAQIIGPVVDVEFPSGNLPEIYTALVVHLEDGNRVTLEVQQHLGTILFARWPCPRPKDFDGGWTSRIPANLYRFRWDGKPWAGS
jgi:hypothetical protein